MSWLKDRLNAMLDNLIWVGIVALAVVVGGSLIAFGGKRANLPVWAVVLFGALLVACLSGVADLYRRIGAPRAVVVDTPPPHRHAALLKRMDALDSTVSRRDQSDAAEWAAAAAFNSILRDAQNSVGGRVVAEIEPLQRGSEPYDDRAYSATYGTISTLIAQMRAVIE